MVEGSYWARLQERRVTRRRLIGSAALLSVGLAGLAVVGCSGNDSRSNSGGISGSGRLVVPFSQDTDQLDPHTNTFTALMPVSLSHAGLLEFVPTDNPNELQVGPYLAEGWEQPEPTVLVFKVRPGAKFHSVEPANGREITAEDVQFSLDRLRRNEPQFVRRAQFVSVERIEVVDGATVRIVTKYPDALLLKYLAEVWMAIVPREAEDLLQTTAVGAGPFVMKNWERGVGFEFERFDGFPVSGMPKLKAVRVPVMTDVAARVAALRSGEIDLLPDVPLRDQDPIASDKSLHLATFGQPSFQYLRFNLRKVPFNDPRVRRAISMAINRRTIVDTALLGKGRPSGVIPWPVPGALPPEEFKYYKYDIAEAKKLLTAAGVEEDLVMPHLSTTSTQQQQDIAAVVLDQMRTGLGIRVEDRTLEYNAYLSAVSQGEFSTNVHWGLSYGDIDGYLQEFLTTGGRNYGGWGSPDLDKKILAQRQILDEEERMKAIDEIQRILADEMYAAGLANWYGAMAWKASIRDYAAHAIPYVPMRWLNRATTG